MIKVILSIFSLNFVLALHAPEYNQYKEYKVVKSKPSIQSKIVNRAIEYGVPTQLALDIAYDESKFNSIISEDGKNFGIFQINEITIKEYEFKDNLLDADTNIDFSMLLLHTYFERYHDEAKVKHKWRYGR